MITPFDKIARVDFDKNRGSFYLDSLDIEGIVYEDERYRLIDLNIMLANDALE